MQANSGDPDQTQNSVESDLGLHCLSIFHKKDAMHIWVKMQLFCYLLKGPEMWEVDCWNNLPSESALGISDLIKLTNIKIL